MKKLVSLIMALALVLGLATVAFAADEATVLEDISWNAVNVGTTYQWTAPAAGNLDLSSYGWVNIAVSVENEEAGAYYYGDWGGVNNLAAGDVVTITVTAIEGSQDTSDYLTGNFVAMGSINNPYSPDWTWDGLSYETPAIAPSEGAFFYFNGIEGSTMVIESAEVMAEINEKYYLPTNGVLSYEFEVGGMGPRAGTSGTLIQLVNTGAQAQSFKITFNYPLGTQMNPEVITEFNTVLKDTAIDSGWNGLYYYSFTAPTEGTLTFYIDDAEWADKGWDVIEMTNYDSMSYVSGNGEDCVTKQLAKDEKIIIFTACNVEDPMPAVPVAFSFVGPEGTISNPIAVSAAGDYQVEGDEVWYAVNSMLSGYIVVATGDDAYLKVGDNTINAVDGVATAVLNGDGAVIPVAVGNATDMIILPAPIEISAAGDYTADVAAGAEVEYAVNSKLAGAILTVEGEDAYILIGTTKYVAVDGVATATLDGTGATIAVKIGNAGTAAAQYALNIAYAPTAITATGDYTVNVGAGAEVEYAVNSKLAGTVLTVKGEKAYIVMGDTKVAAVDGVASVVLDGEGATIAVKIGNAGDASAEYAFTIEYAPEAINATGDYTANVPAGGEVEYVVNSKLDGAVVTVKGEGAYLIVNGKKVEGKDGVVTATLKAEAATISLVVGNAGKEAAQYTVNVDVPADIPATGDMGVVMSVAALAMSAIGGVAVVAKKKEF